MKNITLFKQNDKGLVIWVYHGRELHRQDNLIIVEAFFNRADTKINDLVLKNKDRFVETFFSDRWYNIFSIYDKDTNEIKGWYCDICRPANISDLDIKYQDLGLDLVVFPDGRKIIVDQDEFDAIDLDDLTRKKALESLQELENNFFAILDTLPKVQE